MLESIFGALDKILGIVGSFFPSREEKLGRDSEKLRHHEEADDAEKRMGKVERPTERSTIDKLRSGRW